MALHILHRLSLARSGRIVEVTSGNTGILFAAIGRAPGHPVTIFIPGWDERRRIDDRLYHRVSGRWGARRGRCFLCRAAGRGPTIHHYLYGTVSSVEVQSVTDPARTLVFNFIAPSPPLVTSAPSGATPLASWDRLGGGSPVATIASSYIGLQLHRAFTSFRDRCALRGDPATSMGSPRRWKSSRHYRQLVHWSSTSLRLHLLS
jgi:hypothetical protein